ncbi:MAG: ATPase [Calditrichaeota bacterium]|nr:ATPase [Calditrichota bacterium]
MNIVDTKRAPARIVSLKVQNYRALRLVEFRNLQPMSVFIGPNGSGKSTLFDVFAFLSDCFVMGLRKAWDKRGRFQELRSRGQSDPIVIEIRYREPSFPIITYRLEFDEVERAPVVKSERLSWRRAQQRGQPFRFLDFENGQGKVISGDLPDKSEQRVNEALTSNEELAVSTLGRLAKHPRVSSLRKFIADWYLSYMNAEAQKGTPEAGPQERLSLSGENLPNVIQYLKEQHPTRLDEIQQVLRKRIPRLSMVDPEVLRDHRLLLQIKDEPFDQPILAKFASDGTLKMLSYLVLLYDPKPPQLIGLEEPENQLYPRLMDDLAEECRKATARTQLMITSHSPEFVDGLKLPEIWLLERGRDGYTTVTRAEDVIGAKEHIGTGAKPGQLWLEGFLGGNLPSS